MMNREEPSQSVGLRILEAVRRREPQLMARIEQLVSIESPSSSKLAVDLAQTQFAAWAEAAGDTVRRHTQAEYGDSLEVVFRKEGNPDRAVMLLGHLDTVWDVGTLRCMPFVTTPERIFGPGVLDMKAGVAMALTALETLIECDLLQRPVTLLLHGEEEVGSPVSRSLTERLAKLSSAVYVLEPAQGAKGAYKTARKAVGRYRLAVSGKSAHSGVDFERGHSAIVELARQIQVLQSFTDLSTGLTVNPGVIGGGTLSNVIAAEAWVDLDVRLASQVDIARIEESLHGLRPVDPGCTLNVSGGINRPPMERSAGTIALYQNAKTWAALLGFLLEEASTGGASDGNFTSALGIPTLDGMGAVGAGAHAHDEHLVREHLVPRTALLAAMLL